MGVVLTISWTVFVVLSLIWFVTYHWKRRKLYVFASKINGPPAIPILGNALLFFCKQEEILDRVCLVIKTYDSPIRFWLGPKLLVAVKTANDIEKVLSSNKLTYKDDVYDLMQPYIGQGLISGSGPKWKAHRKIIAPTFHQRILEGYVNVFDAQTKILIKVLQSKVDQPTFDVMHLVHLCTVDIVCETIMDVKLNAQQEQNKETVYWFDKIYSLIHERIMKVWLHPDPLYKLTSAYQTLMEGSAVVINFINQAIMTKKIEMKVRREGFAAQKDSNLREQSTMEQLLKLLESNPDLIDKKDFIYEMLTLFTASQDTTATQMAFVLVILGMYPDIQEKVYQEVKDVVGDSETIEYDHLCRLHYIEMVVKESLRLFTIAPFIIRKVTEDFPLESCTLPKGSSVTVPIHIIHRDPEHWERPEEFYPEHFLPEAIAKRHAYTYMPFSLGPRACIGKQYAMLCLKTMVALIVRQYRIDADGKLEDIKLWCDITCRSLHGYKIRVSNR